MFKIVRKQTRPSANVPFFQGQNDPAITDEFRNYFYETYVLTGKFISSTPVVSGDGLELIITAIWNSESEYNEGQADPVLQQGMLDKARAHQVANDIVAVEISRETF